MNKKVSIIMGIYNCEKTLDEAIQSILSQTYTDWDMIMCDDGSNDNTYSVAKKYVSEYPDKFILIKNDKNLGLNKTLNKCLKLANGDYIARMDGDDISLPTRFEKEVDFLDKHPEYAIVSTAMEYFDDNGVFGHGVGGYEPDKYSFLSGSPFCHAPCMVRRNAYIDVGGYSEEDKLLRVEDFHLWVKMYAKGYKGYNLPEVLYKMRDDRNAVKRRRFKYRINEARVVGIAIKELNLPKKNYIRVLRPIIVGLIPSFLYNYLHKRRLGY